MIKIIESHLNATLCIKNKNGDICYLSYPYSNNLKKIFKAISLRDAFFFQDNNPVNEVIEFGKKILIMDNKDDFFDFSTLTIVEVPIVAAPFPQLNTLINTKDSTLNKIKKQ